MTPKDAEKIAGKLSNTSKMPGYSYSLPSESCMTGQTLRKEKGSVCSSCYACKGRYLWPNVKRSLMRRKESIVHPQWVEAMVTLIKFHCECPYFRWHDSGDLQGREHFQKIVDIANACPEIHFWLPTKEHTLLRLCADIVVPKNLVIRKSMHLLGAFIP